MQLFDFKGALLKPLREKDAAAKVGSYLTVATLFSVISLFISLSSDKAAWGNNNLAALISLALCFITPVLSVVTLVFNAWYMYEYTQAAIEQRETAAFWRTDFMTTLKKAGKFILVGVVYYLPVILIVLCLMVCLMSVLIGSVGSVASMYSYNVSSNSDMTGSIINFISMFGAGAVVVCGLMGLVVISLVAYQNYVVLPATLRLIKTNTFQEAFKVSAIWQETRQNLSNYTLLLLIQVGLGIVIGLLTIPASLFSGNWWMLSLILLVPAAIIGGYYQGFFWPTFTGNFYRELKK